MDLSAAGLSSTEANTYKTLLTKKEWLPAELAKNVGESRTNIYKILDNLTELGLAEKYDKNKKIHYKATHPSHLLSLAQVQRAKVLEAEKILETNAQSLLSDFIKIHEQPGVRYLFGLDGIREAYEDQAKDGNTVYFLLSPKAIEYFGFEEMHSLRMIAVNAGVQRIAITPDNKRAPKNYQKADAQFLLSRTFIKDTDYTAPTEWGVYGNKVYIITFGDDAMAMIIDSPSIAEGLRQLLTLITTWQKRLPEYAELPLIARG